MLPGSGGILLFLFPLLCCRHYGNLCVTLHTLKNNKVVESCALLCPTPVCRQQSTFLLLQSTLFHILLGIKFRLAHSFAQDFCWVGYVEVVEMNKSFKTQNWGAKSITITHIGPAFLCSHSSGLQHRDDCLRRCIHGTGKESTTSFTLSKRSAMSPVPWKSPGEGRLLSPLQERGQDSMPEVSRTQRVINI